MQTKKPRQSKAPVMRDPNLPSFLPTNNCKAYLTIAWPVVRRCPDRVGGRVVVARITTWDIPLVAEVVRGEDGWYIELDQRREQGPLDDFNEACFACRQAATLIIDRCAMQATQAQAMDIGPTAAKRLGKPDDR